MTAQFFIALKESGIAIYPDDQPDALAQIHLITDYAFDSNVQCALRVIDSKDFAPTEDPLHNLVFQLKFFDKTENPENAEITTVQGRLFTGGGLDALEEQYASDMGHIMSKIDFYSTVPMGLAFFKEITSSYDAGKSSQIIDILKRNRVFNELGSYRSQQVLLTVPASLPDTALTVDAIKSILMKMEILPNYFGLTNATDLTLIEALGQVVDKFNNHCFIDVGKLSDWRQVVGLINGINMNDHRFRFLWSPNESRASNARNILSRPKWRPCVGDYLAKHLLRNANVNVNGIPPLNIPIGGYDFPVSFTSMQQMPEVNLSEEAQNALAKAKVIVVLNERFASSTRWIYGDVLTMRNSKNGALRLANAAEIETYTANLIIAVIKRYLLTDMTYFLQNTYAECERLLNFCVAAGLLVPSSELAGRYYDLQIAPRADKPFEAVDVSFVRRPVGAVRQAYLKTTITR